MLYEEAAAMKAWLVRPSDWFEMSRVERAFIVAYERIQRVLLEASMGAE
jgi:hypothetical protein